VIDPQSWRRMEDYHAQEIAELEGRMRVFGYASTDDRPPP
jgi:hypothetical protein